MRRRYCGAERRCRGYRRFHIRSSRRWHCCYRKRTMSTEWSHRRHHGTCKGWSCSSSIPIAARERKRLRYPVLRLITGSDTVKTAGGVEGHAARLTLVQFLGTIAGQGQVAPKSIRVQEFEYASSLTRKTIEGASERSKNVAQTIQNDGSSWGAPVAALALEPMSTRLPSNLRSSAPAGTPSHSRSGDIAEGRHAAWFRKDCLHGRSLHRRQVQHRQENSGSCRSR